MKTRLSFLTTLGACLTLAMLSPMANAEVTILFDGEQTPFDKSAGGAFEKWANVSGNTGFDGGGNGLTPTAYGIVPGSSPFGTGVGARIFDNATDEKPEVQGEFGAFDELEVFTSAPLMEPFRIDIDSQNNLPDATFADPNDGNHAIRFRMANSLKSITSESRSAFSISYEADGQITAKYSGLEDFEVSADPSHQNDVDTVLTDPLVGPQTMTMVANAVDFGGADYTYTLFGQTRTINPQHYDVFINGLLLNDGTHADFANGMQFHTEKSFGNYFADEGIGRFGIVGSSNADTNPDFSFDNIVLRTGADIEASASVLGDFDNSGVVDLADLDMYIGNIGATVAANPGLAALDLDGNGTIEGADLVQHYTDLVGTSNGQTGTFAGDANLDGVVDVLGDAAALINNLGPGATSWAQGDFNGDGIVDVLGDAAALINNLGADNGGGGAAAPAASAVPEPGSLSLLVMAAIGLGVRRKR